MILDNLPINQTPAFSGGHDAKSGGAGLERRPTDVARTMAVAVRLHDCPELGSLQHLEESSRVVADRAEVDRDLAPVHRRPA